MDERFQRQIPLLGFDGQDRLRAARVLVIGAGGLGCPVAIAMAAAGVGHITLVDDDRVAATNLHRQTLFAPVDVGRVKVAVAQKRLMAQFPDLQVDAVPEAFTADNAAALVAGHDIVVEGTDATVVRYIASEACQRAGMPLVTGAVEQWHGHVAVLQPGRGCYACLWPAAGESPSCADAGIVAAQTGLVGNWMAGRAIRYLAGVKAAGEGNDADISRLWLIDGATGRVDPVPVRRRPGCPCHDFAAKPQSGAPAGKPMIPETTPHDLRAELTATDVAAGASAPFVLDVREASERAVARIDGDHAHIPLMQVPSRVADLPRDRRVVVYCAAGARSAQATHFLRQHGIDAVNLHGGMHGWLATA